MGGAHFFHLDEIPTMYGIVNVVAVVRIERQQHIAQGGHSNGLTVALDNRNGPTMAIEHLDHEDLTVSVFLAVTTPADMTS